MKLSALSTNTVLTTLLIISSVNTFAAEDDCRRGTRLVFKCQAHEVTKWPASQNDMDRNLGALLVQIYQDVIVCQGLVRSYAQFFFSHTKGTERSPSFDARIDQDENHRQAVFNPMEDSMVRIRTDNPTKTREQWNATIEHSDRHTGTFELNARCTW